MNTETERLLVESAEWRLLSLLFDCPNKEWFRHVKALGEQVRDDGLKNAAAAAEYEATEGVFHSIFGPGGPAPGREVSYRGWVQPGYLLSEISGYYKAFSYTPVTSEVPDHVSVESGFISYMKLKEYFARQCHEVESAEITADAANEFAADHLAKYAEKLSKLLSASGYEYLELAGQALFSRVGPDADKGRQVFLPMLEEEDEALFECGAAAI